MSDPDEWRHLLDPEYQEAMQPNGTQVMPKVNGRSFRCECGANVFTLIGYKRYKCNGCKAIYQGE